MKNIIFIKKGSDPSLMLPRSVTSPRKSRVGKERQKMKKKKNILEEIEFLMEYYEMSEDEVIKYLSMDDPDYNAEEVSQ